jgi:protein-S-isoprenylcysteine O-methyltransferase Ste14
VFRWRNSLAPVLLVVFLATTRPHPFLGTERGDALLDTAGALVALAGQALRILVVGLAYIKRGGRRGRIAADRLVTEGVFAHCRNPLYLGNFLIVLGLALVWNSPAIYLFGLPLVAAAYFCVIRAEETFLEERFGEEYRSYCRRVNRWLPNPRGFGRTWRKFSFDFQRVLRKEHGTPFALATALVALLAAEKLERVGIAGASGLLAASGVVWLVVALAWAEVHRRKKAGLLGSGD